MFFKAQGQIYSGHCPERYIVIKKLLMVLCCIPATKSACHHRSFIWYNWLSTPLGGLSYHCLEPEYIYKITKAMMPLIKMSASGNTGYRFLGFTKLYLGFGYADCCLEIFLEKFSSFSFDIGEPFCKAWNF